MRSTDDFKAFYQTIIEPKLVELEDYRSKEAALKKVRVLVLVGFLFCHAVLVLYQIVALWTWFASLAFCVLVGQFFLKNFWRDRHLEQTIKDILIRNCLGFLVENSQTDEKPIPFDSFAQSQLFHQPIDHYTGEATLKGKIGGYDAMLSFVEAGYETLINEKKKQWITVFRGLFVEGKLNGKFNGLTYILPNTWEKNFGYLGEKMKYFHFRYGEGVRFHHPDFSKYFAVFSNDSDEATDLINEEIREALVEIKKSMDTNVSIVLTENKIFMAIPTEHIAMHISPWKKVMGLDEILNFYQYFGQVLDIVIHLNKAAISAKKDE